VEGETKATVQNYSRQI